MSEAPITEGDLQAYADGRLPESRRAAVEAWLAARPDEAERIAAYRRLASEVRAAYEGMISEPVPERLARAAAPRIPLRRIAAVAGWVVLGVVIGAPLGWQVRPERIVAQPAP